MVITALYVDALEQPVSGARLRSVPLARIEASASSGVLRERLLAAYDDEGLGAPDPMQALAVLRAMVTMGGVEHVAFRGQERTVLTRPGPSPSDAFYRQVATEYLLRAGETRAPAAALASEAGVPVGTVHRWVREARRRGHLPAGRPGRAG